MIDQKAINVDDHIFAISDDARIISTALEFMKIGFEKNEVVMLISEMDKEKIRNTISKEWKVDVDVLEAQREILIKNPEEVLFPGGIFPINSKKLIWEELAENSVKIGKSGMRIFIDVSVMIKKGLEDQVIKFESTLDKKFKFPCTIVCSYSPENIKKMGSYQVEILKNHHNITWYDREDHIESQKQGKKRNCKACGKEFETTNDSIYCSFECAYELEK